MRLVHCLMETAHGVLSYADLVSGGRGVTGSEQTMMYLAQEQAKSGHRVTCYMPTDKPGFFNGVEVLDVRTGWPRLRRTDGADVVIAWLTADFLRDLGPQTLRVLSIQINDWLLSTHGFEQFVDVYVSVSQAHKKHLWSADGHPAEAACVEVLPNGVDFTRFADSWPRVKRRCVYLSSPDRGLHWVLAMWPEIHLAYPDAELHVFYEVQKWLDSAVLLNSEIGQRAKYIVRRLNELRSHGVVVHGAIPPATLAQELLQADVMLYPCDPVRFTEGFGVAVLEACAAGVVPIITDADALAEVYGESGAIIVPRGETRLWTDQYIETVLQVFKEPERIEAVRGDVRAFAQKYQWASVSQLWDQMFRKQIEQRKVQMNG